MHYTERNQKSVLHGFVCLLSHISICLFIIIFITSNIGFYLLNCFDAEKKEKGLFCLAAAVPVLHENNGAANAVAIPAKPG